MLLTAYADTEAAIASINSIGLDYYLMKPWDPPEERLFPALDDLLSDWQATVELPYDGIRVAGTLWSITSHNVKDFLARNRIPYKWLDIEKDPEARALVDAASNGEVRLPVVFCPDGTVLVNPDNRVLADQVGLQTQARQPFYDLVIIGAGPAGLGAGVYAASEGLRSAMVEVEATGGQAGTSSRIENYLGFPSGISGADLAQRATAQATRLGAEILTAQQAASIRVEGSYHFVCLGDGAELQCRAVIIATGVTLRELDAPGVAALTGAGVYYGASLTEAAHYRDQEVYVIGGANSAGQAAMFFSRYASRVTMLVRAATLEKGMSQYLVDQIHATPNISVELNTVVDSVEGDGRLEAVTTCNSVTGERPTSPAAAMFIFIGAEPHSGLVADVVRRNSAGFILTGRDLIGPDGHAEGWPLKRDPLPMETSVPGIFAAGDVRQGAVRRVAPAVGEGAIALSLVHQYLETV